MDPGKFIGMGQSKGATASQGAGQIAKIDASSGHPEREHERQAGHPLPGFRQVDHLAE